MNKSKLRIIYINLITSCRVILTVIYIYLFKSYITNNALIYAIVAILITIFTIFTDVLDGYLARKLNCITKLGQTLDVYTDFFYIICSLIMFCYFDIVNIYFLIVVAYKFIEFLVLSSMIFSNKYKIKKTNIRNGKYYYDYIGRIVSILYYILPTIVTLLLVIGFEDTLIIINKITMILTILTIISSIVKIMSYIKLRS